MTKHHDDLLSEEELIAEFTEVSEENTDSETSEIIESINTEHDSVEVEKKSITESEEEEKSPEEIQNVNVVNEDNVTASNLGESVNDASISIEDLCKQVLLENQHNDYTVPAPGLYPHQWLWDSCFIAIGLAEYDVERAKKELLSLLRGQWANGMFPNIIFSENDTHKRDKNLWQSWRNPHAPENIQTSGVTQPPMLAEAVWHIGQKMSLQDRRSWYQSMFPAIVSYHEWLYSERDPHKEGLVLLLHPYECGLDNTPPWINQLHMHHKPWWISLIEKSKVDNLFNFIRRDTRRIPPGQRISNIEALLYYNIIRRMRSKNWDTETILTRSHFLVQDLTFNCILLKAGERLKDIAKTIGRPLPESLVESMNTGKEAIEKLWDGYSSQYYSRNFISHRLIKEASIATLMPLYSGVISKERAAQMVDLLKNQRLFGAPFPIPTVPLDSLWYNEYAYWQGPSWINTNWLIAEGLESYGYKSEAKQLRESSVSMVKHAGVYEYFSSKTGEPAGAKNFSWTAALTLHMARKSE